MGMKRRYLAVLMGIMVATTSVPAMVYAEDSKTETAAAAANDESGEADASDENGDESQENVVLGEVKSVSDSEITIAVGLRPSPWRNLSPSAPIRLFVWEHAAVWRFRCVPAM